jgi:hypothetical protein
VRLTRKARLRSAPTGSRQVVDVRPGNVVQAIQWWEKLGYDLHDRSDFETPASRRYTNPASQMPLEHVVLTFVKR